MLRLFRNKIFIGAMCLLLAGILAFFVLPKLYEAKSSTTEIVKLKQTVEQGTVISDDMLMVAEVGSYGIQENVVKDKSEIVGLVARSTIYAGEYLWRERLITEDAYEKSKAGSGYGLPEGTFLLTISLPSESSGVAGILRAGDVVDVYGYTDDGESVAVNEVLTAVKVYEVLNTKLVSLEDLDSNFKVDPDAKTSDYDFAPAYVVFTVDEQQAKVLIGLEKDKSLHLTLRKTVA